MNAPSPRFSLSRLLTPRRRAPGTPRTTGEALRSLLIVVPLTLLIWVYAEKAQNRSEDVTARLAFTLSNADLAATVLDPDASVQVSINGPRGQIDLLKSRILASAADGRLKIALPNSYAVPGEKTVDLKGLLSADPLFVNSGISVEKTTPSQFRVAIDPIITLELTVTQPPNLGVTLQRVTFDPPRVQVRGPQPAIVSEYGGANASISVDPTAVSTATGTGPQTLTVGLLPPARPELRLSVPRVRMTFEIGSAIAEETLPRVFIDIRRPISEDGKYRVALKSSVVIPNVRIRGPANLVTPLTRPDANVKAVLTISQDDVGKGEIQRAADLDLPTGVTVMNGPFPQNFEVRDSAGGADR